MLDAIYSSLGDTTAEWLHQLKFTHMFDLPRTGQFTQGTIFSCGFAESYEAFSVYGLVITARCDVAQDKAPIYSFVPVVSLKDWIVIDGAQIVLDRHRLDHQNTKKNIITNLGLSESLLRTKTTEQIVEGHLRPRVLLDKKLENKLSQFQNSSIFILISKNPQHSSARG